MAKALMPSPPHTYLKLPPSFYEQSTLDVAENLLGKVLVRKLGRKTYAGRIVEVEAYIGHHDPASHAFRGLTPRTQVMFGPPGHAYVYFTYGMYFMLNVVTEQPGFPAAVLIRALEPVIGFDADDPRPANGPGKLCRAMHIDKSLNAISLQGNELWIADDPSARPAEEIRWSSRIGINVGQEHIWRAYIMGNPHVSRKSDPSHAFTPSEL